MKIEVKEKTKKEAMTEMKKRKEKIKLNQKVKK